MKTEGSEAERATALSAFYKKCSNLFANRFEQQLKSVGSQKDPVCLLLKSTGLIASCFEADQEGTGSTCDLK
jgi:hypothetical protein